MKSFLFLMEQIIAILVFAICAAVCVRIFTASFIMSGEAEETNNALIIVKNGAECYKAASGDVEKVAFFLGGICEDNEVRVYYDETRQLCEEDDAVYILSISGRDPEGSQTLCFGNLSVGKNRGKEILTITVAARRDLK